MLQWAMSATGLLKEIPFLSRLGGFGGGQLKDLATRFFHTPSRQAERQQSEVTESADEQDDVGWPVPQNWSIKKSMKAIHGRRMDP